MSTSGGPVTQTYNNPQDFGALGWTDDPMRAQSTATPSLGGLTLVRFRCTKSGTEGHIGYTVTTAGSVLTAGQNFVGTYDTGQALAGSATLLSTSADQTANFGVAGTYQGVLSTPPALVAGQDYFHAILSNGTTAPTLGRMSSSNLLALWNITLAGLALRTASSGAGLTALPATIAAGSFVGGGTGFAFVALP